MDAAALYARDIEDLPAIEPTTMCEVFERTATTNADAVAQRTLSGAEITWGALRRDVHALAGGLTTLGIGAGATVALMLSNRPEFLLADLATQIAGGTPVSIYMTSPPQEIAYLLDDADVRVVICEPAAEPALRAGITAAAADPHVTVIAAEGPDGLQPLLDACPPGFDGAAAAAAVALDDVAVIVYTSGTTGPPKGVQLTHRNLAAMWRAARSLDPRIDRLERVVSYLPQAHVGDRLWQYVVPVHVGASITYVPAPAQLAAAVQQTRPSFFIGVPRIWEKLRIALQAAIPEGRSTADPEVAAMLRERLGLDEGAIAYSGAAPLDLDVMAFFADIGVPMLEGYGMTESSGVIATTRVGTHKPGTVGTAFEGVEVRLAGDGEICVRGENVTIGYRNKPEATAEAIDADGWLRTGDIGRLDEDGLLTVIDRKKEIMITAGGKNLSPANIENAIRSATHLAGPVLAVGDRRPYVTAIVSLDPAEARAWAERHARPDAEHDELARDPALREEIAAAIEVANRSLTRPAQIKRFAIVPEVWDAASGSVTPTMKLKRRTVTEQYADAIDHLYA